MISNWRNYEYFRCRYCSQTWRTFFSGAYDVSVPTPIYQLSDCGSDDPDHEYQRTSEDESEQSA